MKFISPLKVMATKARHFLLNLNQYRNTHYRILNNCKINYKEVMRTLDVTAGTNLTVAEGKTVTLPDALTVKLPVDTQMPVTILSTTAFAGSEGLDDCVVTVEGAEGAFRLRKTATALQVDEFEELDTLTIDATTGAVWSTIAEELGNSKQALSADAVLTINFGDGDTRTP